jgi:VanZ family protein
LKTSIKKIWLIIGIAIVAFLWFVSLMPAPPYIGIPNEDKYAHLISYGGTMWWWAQLWPTWQKRLLLAILFALMGVAIEFAQGATGWRTFDVMDMLANSAGVVVGWVVAMTPLGKLLGEI